MSYKMICRGLLAGLLAFGLAPKTQATTDAQPGDTNWTGSIRVTNDFLVDTGSVLVIEAGTEVLMGPDTSLLVRGQLLAQGISGTPIRFTREQTGTTWERILFEGAADSLLRHCIIEFSNCEGDHKDYYDTDCDPVTPLPARSYFQAVVAIACHVDIEGCVFQNLPDDGSGAEGDAIAIISDDPLLPGDASAVIRDCQFLNIGQGVHTRYSHVLVEGCYFTGHNGDNDDVDLYGESTPPSLILGNLFLNPNHDDMINPTRCSAIIIGNVVAGCDDHGIVLRDKCEPILINNLIYNCSSAGIAVQNQCDALLINNTIVNCGRGVRFFDHTSRWGPPYCLFPGNGSATLINCIIWDCPTTLSLTDSPAYDEDPGAYVTVSHSLVEGGQGQISIYGSESTVTWGAGNLSSDPAFVDEVGENYQLTAGSPCVDAGTNITALLATWGISTNVDFLGTPRPLDGDANDTVMMDIGAYEFLLASADSNGDGIPDGWSWNHGLDPTDPNLAAGNPDMDPHTTGEEWFADTDPMDPESFLRMKAAVSNGLAILSFLSSTNREYTMFHASRLAGGTNWLALPGHENVSGTGQMITLTNSPTGSNRFYRVQADLP